MAVETLARRVGLQMILVKRKDPAPRNRAEARKKIRGRGPHMFGGIKPRTSNRRVTTREKRAEQRVRASGRRDPD